MWISLEPKSGKLAYYGKHALFLYLPAFTIITFLDWLAYKSGYFRISKMFIPVTHTVPTWTWVTAPFVLTTAATLLSFLLELLTRLRRKFEEWRFYRK